jgi:flagellar operon protein
MIDPIRGLQPTSAPGAARPASKPASGAFGDVLAGKLVEAGPLKFSGHALDRIQRRGIDVGATELARLQDGVARAAAKGGRESLVLVDGTAFVVSVPNRTVITAVDREHMREQVFTNIDSAVIA